MLNKVKFTRKVNAEIYLEARDWQLYSSMHGVEEAAPELNSALQQAILMSSSAGEAMVRFAPTLRRYREFGACDTEPVWVAQEICNKAFGDDD